MWDSTARATDRSASVPRHSGVNNVMYADGHVKSTKALVEWQAGPAQARAALEGALPFQRHICPRQDACGAWNAGY
jgi:prepilin-type processing-associated H-X9-DG protein